MKVNSALCWLQRPLIIIKDTKRYEFFVVDNIVYSLTFYRGLTIQKFLFFPFWSPNLFFLQLHPFKPN
jgi:hypothetical protein